ncbi:MAG: cobalamin B12-binding domain-containing protein [Nitrospirae bacterium]|nr:cobalamin B12-binding domain-containing protein [Nitrospirota bacterium]
MKILFVQPGLEKLTNEYPPIGILYLASVVREHGYAVDFYDASAEGQSLAKALDYVDSCKPSIIALSLYTIGLLHQYDFAGKLKKANPECIIIAGGPHATALPVDTMEECPELDFLIFGEGEESIIELLDSIKLNLPKNTIKGICYRSNENIVCNEKRELINDLDTILFPAFDLVRKHNFQYAARAFEMSRHKGAIITSRGCPSKCEFCFKATFGSRLRRRSPGNVAAEMAWQMKEFGIKEFQFVDDLFAVSSRWLNDFFMELKKQDINVPWKCLSRVNTIKEDDIREMKTRGCYGIEFGVESGNDEILIDINKNITLDQVRWAFRTSRKYGMLTFGFFIFGHRKDTHETIKQTMKIAKEISPDMPGFAVLLPFPGTGVYRSLDEGKRKNWDMFNSYYDKSALPLSICSVTPQELRSYGGQAESELYGSLSFLLKNVIFRRGIRFMHRVELFYKCIASMKVVNKLHNENRRIFSEGPFNFNYLINQIIITFAVMLMKAAGPIKARKL